jgi:hypothetical protein
MQLTRQQVVDVLRRAGLFDDAEDAGRLLPDPVDLDYVEKWGAERGITRDVLVSIMGGSS